MKILIVSNYYSPEKGAAPNRITMMAEGLVRRGNEVTVICPMPNYPEGRIFEGYRGRFSLNEWVNGVEVQRYWIYPSNSKNVIARVLSMFSFSVSQLSFLFKYKKLKSYDRIIVQHSPLMVSFFAIFFFSKVNRNIVLNVSDLWPLSALELGAIGEGRFYSLLEKIERYNYRKSRLIMGQSQEILDHVEDFVGTPKFLYRNLQDTVPFRAVPGRDGALKIVYAGLLGVAQGVNKILRAINFSALNVEFHIYGDGAERREVEEYISSGRDAGVFYHGMVSKTQLYKELENYHAAVIPLVTSIKGAVPSKIYEMTQLRVPILFCGGGDGAAIIGRYRLGLCSDPGDFPALQANIEQLEQMDQDDYQSLVESCEEAARSVFDFEEQLSGLNQTLESYG